MYLIDRDVHQVVVELFVINKQDALREKQIVRENHCLKIEEDSIDRYTNQYFHQRVDVQLCHIFRLEKIENIKTGVQY